MHWQLLQILDSAFPAGSLAHSAGVEAAWKNGYFGSPTDLRQFLQESIVQWAHQLAPFVVAVAEGANVTRTDAHLETLLTNHVANRGSRLQGHSLLATACHIFPSPCLQHLRSHVSAGTTPGHHPIVFGSVMKAQAITPPDAARAFLYTSLRTAISAAVRLGVAGPLEGQKLQALMYEHLDACAKQTPPVEGAVTTSPMLEMLQMSQDRLYSRLFQS